jgi:hypothetical protein
MTITIEIDHPGRTLIARTRRWNAEFSDAQKTEMRSRTHENRTTNEVLIGLSANMDCSDFISGDNAESIRTSLSKLSIHVTISHDPLAHNTPSRP